MFDKFKEDYQYSIESTTNESGEFAKRFYINAIDTIIHQMNIPHIIHGKDLYINGYEAHHEKTAKYLQEQRKLIENYE